MSQNNNQEYGDPTIKELWDDGSLPLTICLGSWILGRALLGTLLPTWSSSALWLISTGIAFSVLLIIICVHIYWVSLTMYEE